MRNFYLRFAFFFLGGMLLFSLYTNYRLLHVAKDLQIYIDAGCHGRYQGDQP